MAESAAKFERILGHTQTSKAGFRSGTIKGVPPLRSYEYRKSITDKVKEIDESATLSKAATLAVQGLWTQWCDYARNDFSWKTLRAMPRSLSGFCLKSTFNVLPSPANLKQWDSDSAASCPLCHKDSCTVAHVLGACPFSLHQKRFNYRHDSILKVIEEHLAKFLDTNKGRKPASRSWKSFFVKAGHQQEKKPPRSGILFRADDWEILSDLNNGYCFPLFIAPTGLRPDIVIFSRKYKIVIIVELTSPCEENFIFWNGKKLGKYEPLRSSCVAKGWKTFLFAVEVGARGYCSNSLSRAFYQLGFSCKQTRELSKECSMVALKTSFAIWIARDSPRWDILPVTSKASLSSAMKGTQPPVDCLDSRSRRCRESPPVTVKHTHQPIKSAKLKPSQLPSPTLKVRPRKSPESSVTGLYNKGNTCYVNAILQMLTCVPPFWSTAVEENVQIPPLFKAITLVVAMLKKAKRVVDPSNVLLLLSQKIGRSINSPFDIHQQRDVPEILQTVLDELVIASPDSMKKISVKLRYTFTCSACAVASVREENQSILPLPFDKLVQNAVDKFLGDEELVGENKRFCEICNRLTEAVKETDMLQCPDLLFVSMKRFKFVNGQRERIQDSLQCDSQVSMRAVCDNEVSCLFQYNLISQICHSGDFSRGHYWTNVFRNERWFSCNDESVELLPRKKLNNKHAYVLVYQKI